MVTFRHGIPLRKIDLPFRFVNPRSLQGASPDLWARGRCAVRTTAQMGKPYLKSALGSVSLKIHDSESHRSWAHAKTLTSVRISTSSGV